MTVSQKKDHPIGDPLCQVRLLLQILQGRSKCSTNTRMVEPTRIELATFALRTQRSPS